MDIFDEDLEHRVWRLRHNSEWTLRRIAKWCGISYGKVYYILKSRKTRLKLPLRVKRQRARIYSLSDCYDV